MSKKNVIIRSIFLLGVFVVSVGVLAQNNDTTTYRLKTTNQSLENGEKIIIKNGESSPYGNKQWIVDEEGNKILVIRKTSDDKDSSRYTLRSNGDKNEKGEKVLYRNGEKIPVEASENKFEDGGEWQTDEQGRQVYVITRESGKKLFIYSSDEDTSYNNTLSEKKSLELYPNPTPNVCNVLYFVEEPGTILLELVNQEGKNAGTLLNGHKEGGTHTLRVDLSNYNNGMYYIRYTNNKGAITKKILKLE